MATQPDTAPDIITPQSLPETSVPTNPTEGPNTDLPGISEPAPAYDQPDTAPMKTPPPA